MKITITGDLGSGKSTIAKILSEELNLKYLSTGAIQRDMARRYGMTTLELNNLADTNKDIDKEIDDNLRALNTLDKNFVVDSRLGWFFIPSSIKLYFLIDIEVAAKRIMNDSTRINETTYTTLQETMDSIILRKSSENNRFLKEYKADCSDYKNFDLTLNTTELKTITIARFIIKIINQKDFQKGVIWCNPKILFPTQNINETFNDDFIDLKDQINLTSPSSDYPISVFERRGKWAILDGHKRASIAIQNGVSLVPVRLIAKNEELLPNNISANKYFDDSIKASWLHDWEQANKFKFYSYPEVL
ncbi:(d)CMP kinase [Emticicia sp.]|uniref:(d)CMP kinase n=1 Tax=Emticicia sp. TaxID=1930953 RepID=UPI0037511831